MKIAIYSAREDEAQYIKKFSEQYEVEVILCKDGPSIDNVQVAKGCQCISIVTTKMDKALLLKFQEIGVKFISTRTVGYEHIDVESAKKLGIQVDNISYSPSSVAEYTLMLILMALRKVNMILERSLVQDYSLHGIQGRELHNLTVGVIGTGRIGQRVIQYLKGCDSNILAYDLYENPDVSVNAKYVSLEELLNKSDIITLHVPATEDNYHLINKKTISLMKKGVILINTARGTLIHTQDLIDAIEDKKIGGAALDVIENEANVYRNLKGEIIKHRELAILKSYPNVIITPHTAFYTDQAVSDMVENSIKSCLDFLDQK